MAKRRVVKKPKTVFRTTKAKVRKTAAQSRANNNGVVVHGNAATPLPPHPFRELSPSELIDLDLRNHGFNHLQHSPLPPRIQPPRRKLPKTTIFATKAMDLMQNKIFHLREHFVVEAKALMWRGEDKKRTTPSECAMLAEAADEGKLLVVSKAAQDCIRLVLCYDALFVMEGKREDRERKMNEYNRGMVWEILRGEIAEQLPGDKRMRERRAEKVLHGALDLVDGGKVGGGEDDGGIVDEVVDGMNGEGFEMVESMDEVVGSIMDEIMDEVVGTVDDEVVDVDVDGMGKMDVGGVVLPSDGDYQEESEEE
ncbi:hypothetical protein GRF29_154g37055 [Pseudopithomyces chartarum]|uniref:Uncharacterized protein n=1 Tax=Pseudopithomyces chartarum TaxID=1892770 RepID=A0AAN6LQU4_9PLEO|nr:hypothetical protein GRF29_154g37055 [Pseudopithomyces chartarum]